MAGYLILLFIFLILLYLLFAPFFLEIDTKKELYRLRFHRLASIKLKSVNSTLKAEIIVAGWRKEIDLFKREKRLTEKPELKKPELKEETKKISWKKIQAVLTSFKVNKYDMSVDTGDMQLNGMLFPVFYLARAYSGKNIRINFIGENKIILELENNLARMSWAYFSS